MAGNRIEAIKQARDGLDILDDLGRWADAGVAAIPEDDLERLKWFGLFHRKATPGFFMLRIRIPNGVTTAEQLCAVAEVAQRCGRGHVDLTTRQAIQLRWISIQDVPWIFQRLSAVGLTSLQSGMDNVRNIVACPLAGFAADEVIDTRPLAACLQQAIVGHRAFSNLPRKFNISVSGCPQDCTHAQTHDLSFTVATAEIDGVETVGFNVLAGGALGGQHPMLAEPLDLFVTQDQLVPTALAVLQTFRDHGMREKRAESRLKWLLQEWGVAGFREAALARMGAPGRRAGRSLVERHGGDHIGVGPQRDPQLRVVGLLVPVGRMTAEALEQVAHLASRYGSGEVRVTVQQNLLIPNVPAERVAALLAEPLLATLRPDPLPFVQGLVTCTGNDYCHFSLIDTKGEALKLAQALDARYEVDRPIRIHMSGCPHACGQHRLGEIGLQGDRVRVGDEVKSAAHVFSGGRVGPDARLAEPLADGVLVDDLPALVAAQLDVLLGAGVLRRRPAAGA